MRTKPLLALAALLISALSAAAIERGQIDARIGKEPAYQSSPRYCLLVFGPEAKTRVWLVVDGDDLYVDTNANGDLTDMGEKFRFSKPRESGHAQFPADRSVSGITITDGKRKHTGLSLTQSRINPDFKPANEHDRRLVELTKRNPQATVYSLRISVELPALPRGKIPFTGQITQYVGEDDQGYLQFTTMREKAPVIHFGGPWEMALLVQHSLPSGDKPGDLMTMIGTRGRGAGSFASIFYGGLIGEEVHPVAELRFPGKESIQSRVVLTHRC